MTRVLNGQVALVTGGGRGFGREIAKGLAVAGAVVAVTARSKEQLDETVAQIEAASGRAFAVTGDVTKRNDVAQVVSEVKKQFGPISILINNAGVAGPFGPIWYVDPDAWWNAQAIHVRGVFLFTQAVLPDMMETGEGHIINIASRGGMEVTPCLSAYGVGKATQIRLTEHIAAEGKEHGISAFAIEPGTVFTDMAKTTIADPEAQRWVPWMLDILKEIGEKENPAIGFARCVGMCVGLASGRYDALSGRYLIPEDDFDALLKEA